MVQTRVAGPVRNITTAIAIALAGQNCLAAPGMMTTTPPAQPSGQGFWSKIWRGDDAARPPAPSTPAAMTPPTESRSWWAPASNALGGGPKDSQPRPSAVSLQTPTGALSPKALLVKAQLAEMNNDFETARRCLSQALQQAPNDPHTLREIGHFEDRREQLGLAEQMYRRALASSPRDPALMNDLALCCARQGRLDESARLLTDAIALRPEKVLYRNNLAKVLVELGQPGAAQTQLAAVHPAGAARYNLGHLLAAKGDAAGAAVCFRDALRIDPSLAAAADALRAVAPAEQLQVASAPLQARHDPAPVVQALPATAPAVESQPSPEGFPRLLPPVRE